MQLMENNEEIALCVKQNAGASYCRHVKPRVQQYKKKSMEQIGKRNDHQMIFTNQLKDMGKGAVTHMAEDKMKALSANLFGYKLEL